MLSIFDRQNNNILNFITGNFSKKYINKKNFILINKFDLNKKFFIEKNLEIIVIKIKKKNILDIVKFLAVIYNYKKLKKNFILVYKFKNYISANNFIPDWPANYQNLNFFKCCYIWVKNIFKVIFFFKKLELIILEKK